MRRLANILADEFNPRIYRDNGKLDTDYHWKQTQKAIKAALKVAAKLAENPYSDEVQAMGGDDPLATGSKLAKAIRRL